MSESLHCAVKHILTFGDIKCKPKLMLSLCIYIDKFFFWFIYFAKTFVTFNVFLISIWLEKHDITTCNSYAFNQMLNEAFEILQLY